MRRALFPIALSLLFLALPATAGEPTIDVAGLWNLHAETAVPSPEGDGVPPICEFEGTAQISQDGTSISGSAALGLIDGPVDCPMELAATVTGDVVGDTVQMGLLMGGNLGTASFSGSEGDFPDTLVGNMDVSSGPFAGISGFWDATRGAAGLDIPTLGTVGLVLLVGLLLAAATVLLRRRQAV
ncbi:MAG: IPTL-CTERM sorting domain-containing protein [Acidobacteriota bacterium]|nr:IPTL-CTERM sorting domain-containing protein [Acidobacteriota bacterium]